MCRSIVMPLSEKMKRKDIDMKITGKAWEEKHCSLHINCLMPCSGLVGSTEIPNWELGISVFSQWFVSETIG